MSIPLAASLASMPATLAAAILKAKDRWLDSIEIAAILEHVLTMDSLCINHAPPQRPAGGTLWLVNRKKCNFRNDGHVWLKGKGGKTVERHVNLRVDGKDKVACYYAYQDGVQAGAEAPLTRRSYWLLTEGGPGATVLVHYLNCPKASHARPAAALAAATALGVAPPAAAAAAAATAAAASSSSTEEVAPVAPLPLRQIARIPTPPQAHKRLAIEPLNPVTLEASEPQELFMRLVRQRVSPTPVMLFAIEDFAPRRDTEAGGASMIVTGKVRIDLVCQLLKAPITVSFGGQEVPAEVLPFSGAIRCEVPPALRRGPHQVDVCVMLGHLPVSDSVTFSYGPSPRHVPKAAPASSCSADLLRGLLSAADAAASRCCGIAAVGGAA